MFTIFLLIRPPLLCSEHRRSLSIQTALQTEEARVSSVGGDTGTTFVTDSDPPPNSSTCPSWRCTEFAASASPRATARATRTWSCWSCWTCATAASTIRSSATSAGTTRPAAAPPPTAAGTATAKSSTTRPSTSGTARVSRFLIGCC